MDCIINRKRNSKNTSKEQDYSRKCEYNQCNYVCKGIIEENTEFSSTYTLYYGSEKTKQLSKIKCRYQWSK